MELRAAYACDCDGVKRRSQSRGMRAELASSALDHCERVTGTKPRTCPWRSFYVDDVAAVMRAHSFFESGQLSVWFGDDPEAWLIDGVRIYDGALRHALNDARETMRKNREAKS